MRLQGQGYFWFCSSDICIYFKFFKSFQITPLIEAAKAKQGEIDCADQVRGTLKYHTPFGCYLKIISLCGNLAIGNHLKNFYKNAFKV